MVLLFNNSISYSLDIFINLKNNSNCKAETLLLYWIETVAIFPLTAVGKRNRNNFQFWHLD